MSEQLELEEVRNEDRDPQNLSDTVIAHFQHLGFPRERPSLRFSQDFLEIPEVNDESDEEDLRSLSSPLS